MPQGDTGRTRGLRIIVKRGALRRFHRLKQQTVDLPVSVEWDRRTAQPDDPGTARPCRPTEERRGPLPFTWQVAEFVAVNDTDG
jgi:hypothetical protein